MVGKNLSSKQKAAFRQRLGQYFKGKKQQDFEVEHGFQRGFISRYLTGDRSPGLKAVEALAAATGLSVGWWLGEETIQDIPDFIGQVSLSGVSSGRSGATFMLSLKISGTVSATAEGGGFVNWEGIVEEYGYAVVEGDDMAPYVEGGDQVKFHMTRTAKTGDMVVVRLGDGQALLRFVELNGETVVLSTSRGQSRTMKKSEIIRMYPVDSKRGGEVPIVPRK